MRSTEASNNPSISVRDFVAALQPEVVFEVLSGHSGLDVRKITVARIQKLGLALAGFANYIHPGRLQIVGQSEISYLNQLEPVRRREAIDNLTLDKIACILVTKDLQSPVELEEAVEAAGVPLLRTPLVSSDAIARVTACLRVLLAPRLIIHGVFLELYGLGVMIEGESGIGKSECALDLISRGHRLISDDAIDIRKIGDDHLVGRAPEILREHLEIRGLGIINIRDMFGVSAVSDEKRLDLSIRLERWDDDCEIDRLGIDARSIEILGLHIPQFHLPVSPGRNLATLVETAVRVQLLRLRGTDAARAFVARHDELVRQDH